MRYVHYSSEKDLVLFDQTPHAIRSKPNMKPDGLWISRDDKEGWLYWCIAESFWIREYRYEVELKDNNILWIKSPKDLLVFTKKYRKLMHPEMKDFYTIDWERVFYEYNGIMIFPYIWSLRLDYRVSWYYGWDCASGCIWRPSEVVVNIKRKGSYRWIYITLEAHCLRQWWRLQGKYRRLLRTIRSLGSRKERKRVKSTS